MRYMQAWFASMDQQDRPKAMIRLCKVARTLHLYKDNYHSNEETQSNDSDNDDERSAESQDLVPVLSLNRGPIFSGPTKHVYTGKRQMKSNKHFSNSNNHLHSLVTPTGDHKSYLSSMRGSNDETNSKRMKVCMFQYF